MKILNVDAVEGGVRQYVLVVEALGAAPNETCGLECVWGFK
jgi:hypothetical protein